MSASRLHYEDMWSTYEACKEIIDRQWKRHDNWRSNDPVQLFKQTAKTSMAQLKSWSNEEFKGRQRRLEKLMARLKELNYSGMQHNSGEEIKRVKNQIHNILLNEEIYWKQRSRADWLREGDKNTKYFHAKASSRKRKNKIWGIEDSQGNWMQNADEVESEFCGYFADLFTTSSPDQKLMDTVLEGMGTKVTKEMNDQLIQPFTKEEIVDALMQMCPTKAPGPDGLPATFYQKHWNPVSTGVVNTCLHILNEQGTITPLNHTHIALVPKVKQPRKVTDFQPISLCNVIYRIIAKAIANRLKHHLHNIISPSQSAFIPNRLITDNIIIGYECLHKIRHCKGKKSGLVALKLDISKAYDRVEWLFLEHVMLKLGFARTWVNLIMRCITTSSFSIIINGIAKGIIQPQRGLRQGCPLSPYLFLMCAEAFSNLLQRAEEKSLIHGLKFSKDIIISHLLFADDSLIFTKASEADCLHLKRIFEAYAAASGQLFNYDKSSMFFSGNTSSGAIAAIKNIFQLNVVSRHEKYLGPPSMIGRKRSGFFNDIKLRVSSKITNWQHKFFSCGGKEVLIKAVAQAVPAYAMSVFKLPLSTCNDIQQALVAKQSWRIIQFPNSLMARVLQARYFKSGQFLNARLGSKPSFIWRSILWGRQVIHKGIRWRIGNGEQVEVYKGNWMPRPTSFKPVSPPSLPIDSRVSDLINAANQWNEGLINQHFGKEDAEMILRIPLPSRPMEDQIVWHYDKKGIYSVKSGYQVALKEKFPDIPNCSNQKTNQWSVIWTLSLPEKIKIFTWRAAKNLLPTAENLWKRKVLPQPTCQLCGTKMKTTAHALMECKSARAVWKTTKFAADIGNIAHQDILSFVHEAVRRMGKTDANLVIALCWVIWSARNHVLFRGKRDEPCIIAAKAEAVVDSFKRIQAPGRILTAGDQMTTRASWSPPPSGWVKINVDAAINLEEHRVGLGIIIRDANKDIIAAAVKSTKLHSDVTFAEAEAMNWGLSVAIEKGLARVIVESDSQEAVDFVNNRKSSRTEIQWLVAEMQSSLRGFSAWQIQQTPRSCNVIAHSIAKFALEKCKTVV
ncbi:reverse transcriptase domain-containing protein [Citrus sinensis]|uniref:Reverse transcriptase domain-containing protein n=1 Tax=Citrus sinensis TaxID=2711 RepID=A0ACB8MHB7_CITSI|nr:reverse transcriptase domain-containing protein [Citrus sinensis]